MLKRFRANARTVQALLMLCALALTLAPAGARPATGLAAPQASQDQRPSRTWVMPRGGKPFFVMAANYEGPMDRSWAMWDDDKFDPALIEQDFANARWIGLNALRIFVQRPLGDDISAGDFTKLDKVVALAKKYNLWLIVTFNDWAEGDLTRAGRLNAKIASHLAAEPSILAYDTKNEPQFTDIAGAIYPSSTITVPLQSPDLIATYGERVPRASIHDYRQGEGKNLIPARMNDDQAYVMANYYKLYLEFLNAGSDWVTSHAGTTTIDYMDSPDSASWQPFLAALDQSLLQWTNAQLDPVRDADPGRPVTTGFSNIVLARLPSNKALTFQSIHRFTSHGYAGLAATFRVLDSLQRAFAGQPVLLEEFGYPGQVKNASGGVTGYDPRTTANLESAVWAYLYSSGFAGGGKWMLNNYPQGYDPAQNSYGLFDNTGNPKPSAYALRALSDAFSASPPGDFTGLKGDDNYAASYAYRGRGTLVAGGKVYTGTNVLYQASAPSQLVLGTSNGALSLFATDAATVTVNLPAMFGVPVTELGSVTLTGLTPDGQPWSPPVPALEGDGLTISMKALYRYNLSVVPRAIARADARPDANTVYFPQTGHNLGGEFLRYWSAHGSLAIFGYPITEEFTENGYTVQYFQRNRFEYHPENQPPYNVLLGRLGADAVSGRTFAAAGPFDPSPGHRYFPETGHSLNNAFLGYWQRNGGLAQFGFPISEEMREVSPTDGKEYVVQYFERARFEYHPEFHNPKTEVLLGLLGVSSLQSKGWMP